MEHIDSDRAQVILIGGFLIAIGILGAVLIFNNIGFSQTIATQNGNSDDFGPLEFSDSAESAVEEAMTGNGSNPSGAKDHFEAYLESYSNGVNGVFLNEGVSANASIPTPISDLTEVWMVGQRRTGDFNATGDVETWVMAEGINENHKTEFRFDVDAMNDTDDEVFTLNASTESDGQFDSTFNGWRLTTEISTTDVLTLNMTTINNGGLDNPTDETTTDISGNETVVVDVLDETVNGESGAFPSISVTPGDAGGFRFEDGSNATGTYEFRFDDGAGVTLGNGPCEHPDGPPNGACRSSNGTGRHAVGVIHEVANDAVKLSYVGRSMSYRRTIGGMRLDAEDVNLEQINNVDGAAYFDVSIISDNSPVEEDTPTSLDIQYEIVNTGTAGGTQNVTLEIPKGEVRDWTGDLTLDGVSGSNTDTGTLSWSPGPNTSGTYTAYLISENSTDTVTVSVDKSGGAPSIPSGPVGFALPSLGPEKLAGVAQP